MENKEKGRLWKWIKKQLNKYWSWIKPYISTWQGIVGMIISWCLIDGSPYVLIFIGSVWHYPVLLSVGLALEALFWQPWMIEKPLVVIPLGILFKKLLDKWFPSKKKDDKVYNVKGGK